MGKINRVRTDMSDFQWIEETPLYHKDNPMIGMKFTIMGKIVYTITDEDGEYFYLDFITINGDHKKNYEHFIGLDTITVING
jgi:hypothetical protein